MLRRRHEPRGCHNSGHPYSQQQLGGGHFRRGPGVRWAREVFARTQTPRNATPLEPVRVCVCVFSLSQQPYRTTTRQTHSANYRINSRIQNPQPSSQTHTTPLVQFPLPLAAIGAGVPRLCISGVVSSFVFCFQSLVVLLAR